MISTNEFKTGLAIRVDGTLYIIEEYQHVKPGKGGAFMRTKLRHLTQDSVIERTFRAGEKFEEAFIEERPLQFLYKAGTDYHFMDLETYEERVVAEGTIGSPAGFVKENMELKGRFHGGGLIGLGDGAVFAVSHRPVQGTRGVFRVNLRHGVSRLRSGHRHTLGVIFRDAR